MNTVELDWTAWFTLGLYGLVATTGVTVFLVLAFNSLNLVYE